MLLLLLEAGLQELPALALPELRDQELQELPERLELREQVEREQPEHQEHPALTELLERVVRLELPEPAVHLVRGHRELLETAQAEPLDRERAGLLVMLERLARAARREPAVLQVRQELPALQGWLGLLELPAQAEPAEAEQVVLPGLLETELRVRVDLAQVGRRGSRALQQ
jgi:hypothetical protein